MRDFFTFEVPNAKHHPLVRERKWDGKKRLFHKGHRRIYRGLLPYIDKFCQDRGYTFVSTIDDEATNFSLHEAKQLLLDLKLPDWFEIRDHQVKAIAECIRYRRRTMVSATASGKSAIIYAVIRHFGAKTLLLVPTQALALQMRGDFIDYSQNNGWDVDNECSIVMEGYSKENLNPVVISTWQSAIDMPEGWLAQFDMVIVDEAHHAKATSFETILISMPDTELRFGFTGTLDSEELHHLVIQGLLGPIKQFTTTKELMDKGILSELKIKCIVLKHPDSACQSLVKQKDYDTEISYLIANQNRTDYIANLALSVKGNTLILYERVDTHGQLIYDTIKDINTEQRHIDFIHGGVKAEVRDAVRQQTELSENSIIIASYGTFRQGVNIKRLHNIIFASPTKAKIRVLQSIGRGLRTSEDKHYCVLFDIADDLCWHKRKNHTFRHFEERLRIYISERFKLQTYRVKLQ